MANRNQMALAKLHRKALKGGKEPINSRFGSPTNLNKSRKDYARVYKKSLMGG